MCGGPGRCACNDGMRSSARPPLYGRGAAPSPHAACSGRGEAPHVACSLGKTAGQRGLHDSCRRCVCPCRRAGVRAWARMGAVRRKGRRRRRKGSGPCARDGRNQYLAARGWASAGLWCWAWPCCMRGSTRRSKAPTSSTSVFTAGLPPALWAVPCCTGCAPKAPRCDGWPRGWPPRSWVPARRQCSSTVWARPRQSSWPAPP